MDLSEKTREFEQKQARLFSVQKPFSEHLLKWEDSALSWFPVLISAGAARRLETAGIHLNLQR